METFVLLFAQLALVSFVNFKAYHFIRKRVLRTAWIGPLLIFGVHLKISASEIRGGTEGSWLRLVTVLLYLLFAVSGLAAIVAGYRDRRHEKDNPFERESG
jgi:hypothetical protein